MFGTSYSSLRKSAHFNLSHIVATRYIPPTPGSMNNGGYEATAINGDKLMISDMDWKIAIEMHPLHVVPAQPNTFLLERIQEDGEADDIWRMAVLAWGMHGDGVMRPIVIDPEAMSGGEWRVEHPNGVVETSTGKRFENAEAWLASFKPE